MIGSNVFKIQDFNIGHGMVEVPCRIPTKNSLLVGYQFDILYDTAVHQILMRYCNVYVEREQFCERSVMNMPDTISEEQKSCNVKSYIFLQNCYQAKLWYLQIRERAFILGFLINVTNLTRGGPWRQLLTVTSPKPGINIRREAASLWRLL